MNILVTGASGFIGKALTKKLLKQNAHIYCLYRTGNNSDIQRGSNFYPIVGDVTNTTFIKDVFRKKKINRCYHLAAQAIIKDTYKNPAETFDINIRGTWNIFEAARVTKVQGIIMASTINPHYSNPYESSKICAETLAHTYSSYFNVPVAVARFVNTYGPGDVHERIIPHTIQLLLSDKQPLIYTGQIKRDYVYIDDVVNAYLLLMKKVRTLSPDNIVVNFGTGKRFSSEQVIKKVVKIFGKPNISPLKVKAHETLETERTLTSFSRTTKLLGWKPKYILDQGLKKTVEWYKNIHSRKV